MSHFQQFACFGIHDSIYICLDNCFLIAFLKINFVNICWTHMLAAFTAFRKGKVILCHINSNIKFKYQIYIIYCIIIIDIIYQINLFEVILRHRYHKFRSRRIEKDIRSFIEANSLFNIFVGISSLPPVHPAPMPPNIKACKMPVHKICDQSEATFCFTSSINVHVQQHAQRYL